jgi:hypothetical protein
MLLFDEHVLTNPCIETPPFPQRAEVLRRASGLEGSLATLEQQLGPSQAAVDSVARQKQAWHEEWCGRKVSGSQQGSEDGGSFSHWESHDSGWRCIYRNRECACWSSEKSLHCSSLLDWWIRGIGLPFRALTR